LRPQRQHSAYGIQVAAYDDNDAKYEQIERNPAMPGNEIKQVDTESCSIDPVVVVTVIGYGPEKPASGQNLEDRPSRTPEQRQT
jgi:hypothetical protein